MCGKERSGPSGPSDFSGSFGRTTEGDICTGGLCEPASARCRCSRVLQQHSPTKEVKTACQLIRVALSRKRHLTSRKISGPALRCRNRSQPQRELNFFHDGCCRTSFTMAASQAVQEGSERRRTS